MWHEAFTDLFSEKNSPYTLFGIAIIAHLVVFFAMLWIYGPCSFFLSVDCSVSGNDTQHYVVLANNVSHGNGYSRFPDAPYELDALRTPLLPLYFMAFTYVGGLQLIWLAVLLLNFLLAAAPMFIYKLARFYLPHSLALAAGLFLAFEPLYLYRSQIAEPDALFVLLLAVSMYFLVRSWKEGRGRDLGIAFALLGLSILAKPTGQYIACIAFFFEIAFTFFFLRSEWLGKIKRPVLALLILCVTISPWIIRNYVTFGVTSVSSVQSYNLYEYYTKNIALPDEEIPAAIAQGSREPDRYLPFQKYFTSVAIERIKAHPSEYAREHAVGSLRELFVTDISAIYYYGHTGLLPFSYNPESQIDIHARLLEGDIGATIGAFFSVQVLPKIVWILMFAFLYIFAFVGWIMSMGRERTTFLSFTLFLCMYGYLIVSSGPYVDAKYRLPGLPLVFLVALFGLRYVKNRWDSLRARAN